MEKYIPKSVVLAEIENLLDKGRYHEEYDCAYRDGNNGALYALKNKLDTLEVKSVDLNEEVKKYLFNCIDNNGLKPINIAKHFFELGMAVGNKAQIVE